MAILASIGFRFAYSDNKGAAHYGKVINNIFIRCEGYYSFRPELVGSESDFNLVTGPNDGAKANFFEAHGINGGFTPEQVFVDPNNDDFRVAAGSPAIRMLGPLLLV